MPLRLLYKRYLPKISTHLYNECQDPKANDCDKNADCIDTDDGYVCQCKTGFFDENNDPIKTGRVCIGESQLNF
uniref:EGF-like domain-containing protein n=1 Tax=Heterorhabditis bacteriophora TaxID=37862 RepID=A0A1I7XQH9_HETBA